MADEETGEPGFGAWLGFWGQLAGLGLLAVLGVFFASNSGGPGDYGCGLTLALAALALAFLRVKHRFDTADRQGFLFVDTLANLAVVVPLFVAIGLGGLFLAAAWGEGSLHDAGIGLFGASGLIVFLSLKRIYDTLDRRR